MNNFTKTFLTGALMIAASASINAATLEANIPFDFTIGGKAMEAGKYRVETSHNGLVYARSVETGDSAFKLSTVATGNVLVFSCKDGKACEFNEVRPASAVGAKQVAGTRLVTGVLMASN